MKKLSVAVYWHMHQPVYEIEGTYLMPWSRLHAVKDYLDMVLFLDKYPNLKLNIDIVPALLDTLIDYNNGFHDIHSELTVSDVENLSDEERAFILNNFFSSKFETMIYRSDNYKYLYNKRFSTDVCNPADFSNQELSDLMALFNLVWIDPIHFERYPKLKELWNKQYNYTLEDRKEIINIHYQIMLEIIPTYKKFIESGRIELTTSPYYHVILPILLDDKNVLKSVITTDGLPQNFGMADDARIQLKGALERIESIFGVRPKGIWPPELCLDNKTLELMAKEGILWTISDEGILSESTKFEFVRDFKGNLNDPYPILKVYEYQTKTTPINIIFRDRSIPNLINFEYAGVDPQMAAKDLYNKIKVAQNKILASPDETHLLTIALDGENCWENYQNDGNDFLNNFYESLIYDDTIETVLISNYIENDKNKKPITKVQAGSWIDKTFQYWIGETTKNKAWSYLKETKDCFENFVREYKDYPYIPNARRELLIAEGSDWFWWYGEPNNSGQDFVFDYMFREHLKNVYITLGLEPPEYLNQTLITTLDMPFKHPKGSISPKMDGLISSNDEWFNSGNMSLLDGPVFREGKNIDKIMFGCDSENIYFRFHMNKSSNEYGGITEKINQFYIYTRNATNIGDRAHIRLISKTDSPYPILREKFDKELTLTLFRDILYPPRLTTCTHTNLWTLASAENIKLVQEEVIDVTVPFDSLGISQGETVEFFMANTESSIRNTYIPQEILLSMTRT